MGEGFLSWSFISSSDWESFFNPNEEIECSLSQICFRPHNWGSFFNLMMGKRLDWLHIRFRPHDWGSFFNHAVRFDKEKVSVFVPMIGDLFLIRWEGNEC